MNMHLFFDGLATLEKHADYTPEGGEAMRQAAAYMQANKP